MERFWETEEGWVLVHVDDGPLPFNTQTRMARVIDDDDEAERTYREMIEDSVSVLDDLPPQ